MSKRWKWILGIAGITGLVIVCSVAQYLDSQPTSEFHAVGVRDGSLGIDRQAFIELLDDSGFYFERSESIGGEETYTGTGSLGQETIILTGPAHDLKKVAYIATTAGTSDQLGMRAVRRYLLLRIIIPEWDDAADWLSAHSLTVKSTGDPKITVIDGIRITLEYHEKWGFYILTFDPE